MGRINRSAFPNSFSSSFNPSPLRGAGARQGTSALASRSDHEHGAQMQLVIGGTNAPTVNGMVTFEFTSNTSLTIKARGSDGVTRSATLTLA